MGLEVWQAKLSELKDQWRRFEPALSPDEIQRAENMRRESVRRRYIIGRGLLRSLVAERIGLAPAAVRLTYNASGKPLLDPAQASETGRSVAFNLSHSGDRIAIALFFSQREGRFSEVDARIGVDLEWMARRRDVEGLVRRFATERERAEFSRQPVDQQRIAFFRWWTRKEALIKAVGTSLPRAIGKVEVSFGADRYTVASFPGSEGEPPSLWRLATITLEDDYIMTVARPTLASQPGSAAMGASLEKVSLPHPDLPVTQIARW